MKIKFIIVLAICFFLSFLSCTINNQYFFNKANIDIVYKGIICFDQLKRENINCNINKLFSTKKGAVYCIKIIGNSDIPENRTVIGFFYVNKINIYKFQGIESNFNYIKKYDVPPNNSIIVCSEKEEKDSLNSNLKGYHQYIKVNGTQIEYHMYNDSVESGYFEDFTWEKNKGMVRYVSGYGADSDYIELYLTDKSLFDEN